MSDQFSVFAAAVHAQFLEMSKGELFVVDIEGDALYEAYQAAFPAGTNEMFRQAREHECTTCKNFIRNVGNVVAIKDGVIDTVWNVILKDKTYQTVAVEMDRLVHAAPIKSIFRAEMPSYGSKVTTEPANEKNGGHQVMWNHFYSGTIKKHFAGKDAATQIGEANARVQVFRRGMQEITRAAVQTVYDLLKTKGALYRGEEFAFAFGEFVGLRSKFDACKSPSEQDAFIWSNQTAKGAQLRNTAFGTLLIDLSAGMDVEAAVKRWETVMAPQNYKRPVALITPRMVEDAMKTVEELGIEPSLHRRFAKISDVSVNDILYVDNAVRGKMKDGSVKGLLMDVAEKQIIYAAPANPIDISIDEFVATVLPKAKSISLLVQNAHQANFVSLTAPVDGLSPSIFKWDNRFAWSYDGNITDSIKERVKAAGGATDAVFRVSLAWQNRDDLDIHVIEPDNHEIYFGNKGRRSANTGMLDVDMNMMTSGSTFSATEPVENVTWTRPRDGKYRVRVENYNKRSTANPGFTLEVENNGVVQQYSCAKSPSSSSANNALDITIKDGKVVGVDTGAGVTGGAFSQEKWGVSTEKFVRVDTVMLSPNFWGEQTVGNKHYFFILEGCKNPLPTRGLYNEFLRGDIDKHRKVFEVLGNKTMAEPTDDQLSGVGFSSTRGDTVVVQVNGGKIYKITF